MSCSHLIPMYNKYGIIKDVPCGQCISCHQTKQRYLSHLIQGDVAQLSKRDIGSSFLTLTIDNAHTDHSVHKSDLQKLFKRLRKNYAHPFRYLALGDYGGRTQRSHYHVIMIGYPPSNLLPIARKTWHKGFVDCEPLVSRNVNYVVRYISKFSSEYKQQFDDLNLEPPFSTRSQGIGSLFLRSQSDIIDQYGKYFYKGRLYPVSPYHLAKYFGFIPTPEIPQDIIDSARLHGMTTKAYLQHTARMHEYNELKRSQNKLSPPQGVKILPLPPLSSSRPKPKQLDLDILFMEVSQ